LIYPDRLFGTARRSQLLFHLDRATRLAAIQGASEHAVSIPIFINFNPNSVYDPDFCLRSTVQAVEEAGLAPEAVVFEVVESEEIQDVEHLTRIMEYYRSAGFRVALDDLGAGYGSLSLLTRLRPDFVKIDMELIRGVDSDPYRAQIASKLLELAHDLKTFTVAEGVETEAEWSWCRNHGADYAQGYLFGRPACPPCRPASLPLA
jgi:EAL domain-containing protein (putative c-di-GMP-specific phosphodiesterase class I)